MAASANPTLIPACALLMAYGLAAQTSVTLQEAAARRSGDFAPALAGRMVAVRGQVTAKPVGILQEYLHVGIEQGGHGLILESALRDGRVQALQPGDQVEAAGQVAIRGGLPVVRVAALKVLSRNPAPEPSLLPVEELMSFRHLGKQVTTEGTVVEVGENTGGWYLLIGSPKKPYKIFLPHGTTSAGEGLRSCMVGDRVRAVGLASQYCAQPPYNRWFELVVDSPKAVVLLEHQWFLSAKLLMGGGLALLALGFLLWKRERRLRLQRVMLRRAYQLGEETLGASSAEDILGKLATGLPRVLGISGVQLFVYNLGAKTLDKVTANDQDPAVSIALTSTVSGLHAAVAACFQNRTLLAIPDTTRSPFPDQEHPSPQPQSVLFVPMVAQGEVVGVFELDQQDRQREFSPDEQALAQHLGNQIGAAVKLLDQRTVREQLFRTEKLAAVGRLISGVVNELRAPLASICKRVDGMLGDSRLFAEPHHCEREAQAIQAEARRAMDIVGRLVSFASTDSVEAKPLDVNALLRSMAEFREQEWKSRGIRTRANIADEPLMVLGSRGQLEQVILDLLVCAEQLLADASDKQIAVRTSRLGRKVLIEVTYSAPRGGPDPLAYAEEGSRTTLGMGVCRSIVAGHGGELRSLRPANSDPRFEIELPWTGRERVTPQNNEQRASAAPATLTALVIEPDETAQHELLGVLAARSYRVIPVENSDVGLEMAQRIRFDVAFCSVHAPGLNWVELSERLQERVGAFVLVSDGYDAELAADFEGDGRFVLPKPIEAVQMDRVLQSVEGPLNSRSTVS